MPTKVKTLRKVSPEDGEEKRKDHHEFEDALKLLVFGMRVCGIPLDSDRIESASLRNWTKIFCFVSFFLDMAINLLALLIAKRPENTNDWNMVIFEVNTAVTLVTLHATLLIVPTFKWKGIMAVFKEIERLDLFQEADYKKFKKLGRLGGWAFIGIALSSISGGLAYHFFLEIEGFNLPLKFVFGTYLGASGAPFILLCYMVSSLLQTMSDQITNLVNQSRSADVENNNHKVKLMLDRWQRGYYLTGDLIREIGRNFGFIMIVLLTYLFIWLVNALFQAMMLLKEMGPNLTSFTSMGFLVFVVGLFSFMAFTPNRVKQEGQEFVFELRSFRPKNPELRQQVDNLVKEVSLSPLQVTLVGLLDVNLTLIPELIGITLTYIIILLQFKTSE